MHRIAVVLLALGCGLCLSSAWAAEIDGELVFDFVRAESRNDGPGAGEPVEIGAQDLGMRLRFGGREHRTSFAFDYHGREALGGDVQNGDLRLLYTGYLGYDLVPARLALQLGRFLAPSVVFLPVDAMGATFRHDAWEASAFGGRRGILTSRRNVPLGECLPAAGASLAWRNSRFRAEGVVAYSEDEAILSKGGNDGVEDGGGDQEIGRRYGAWNGYLSGWLRPWPSLSVAGRVSFAERAAYTIGPTWENADLDVRTLDLFHANVFAEWRARRDLRASYSVHTQRASVYRSGLLESSGGETLDPPFDPRFTDHRARLAWRALDRGWLRGQVRVRLRPERQENRYGVSLDLDDLGIERLRLRARFFYDEIDPKPGRKSRFDSDRRLYSGVIGYRLPSLELELGASRFRRDDSTYSGRTALPDRPGEPTSAEDLGLFTLETESIAFARSFYVRGFRFGGLDLEINLEDPSEIRLFVQLGTRWERAK